VHARLRELPRREAASFVQDERRLSAAERKCFLEPFERNAQADQPFERTGKTPPRLVECVDAGEPVLLARVHASEEHAVLEHRVDADDRAVELHLAAASVDAEQADDTASPEKAERV